MTSGARSGAMWRILVVVGAAVLVVGVVFAWSHALFPILAGFLLAYLSHPIASFFERHRLPRILGFLVILLLVLGVMALVFVVFVPAVINELAIIGKRLPSWQEMMQERVAPILESVKTRFPQAYELLQQRLTAWAQENLPSVAERAAQWLGKATTSVLGLAGAVFDLVLMLVIGAYLTVDFRPFLGGLRKLVPRPVLPTVESVVGEVHGVLAAFLRGQLLVSLALAAMYTAGLLIVHAPLALVIGLVAGLLSLVPYLGLVVGGGSALILSFLEYQDLMHPLGVVVAFVVAQNIEGWVLTPRLLGRRVGLHPVWVLVALLLGGELFGLPGVIVAVPVAAALRVLLLRATEAYRESAFYRGSASEGVLYVRAPGATGAEVRGVVESVLSQRGVPLRVVDVATDQALVERYGERVPVLELDGEVVAEGEQDDNAWRAALERALEGRT